ncbi:MAG: hypothetical protein GTN98_00500, partial [Woeseiaceae bacterium]|nr:hypothetical protein [Woeseiaceae bacterium]
MFVASHPRNKSITAADADYTQRAAILNSDGGNGAYLYVHERTLANAGTDSADHTIGSITGWDMAGLVINPASAGSCPIDVSIAASSDDAEESLSTGSTSLSSSDLELVNDGADQEIGLRFLNLDIPQGATIDSAYVTFYAKNTSSGGPLDLTFYAEKIGDAPTFVNATNNITNRTKTTASVTWSNLTDWSVADAAHQSPELKTIIQEVVNQGTWAANNNLAIIISGTAGQTRRAWSFDSTGTVAALHVECSPSGAINAVTSAVAEISPNDVTTSSTGNSFTYDIQATINGGDTGVDTVEITVPGSFGAPTVTDVQDDGVSVGYTNNTAGNTISVDLNTKITASSKITVLFDSDAPTSQDLTGVDFTSMVDDSGTADAAQSTGEGNGDGDAGDNNSWTVTTTTMTPSFTSAVAEISPNDVSMSTSANAFTYDVQATIGGGDSGVDTVNITVPGSFSAPSVTGVQVDGSGVAYTDNSSGNNISVNLTTKVTTSSKFTVLFNADAPTSPDATGVNFTSTLDD